MPPRASKAAVPATEKAPAPKKPVLKYSVEDMQLINQFAAALLVTVGATSMPLDNSVRDARIQRAFDIAILVANKSKEIAKEVV